MFLNQKNQNLRRYSELLKDPRWKSFRKKILQRDGNKCKVCGSEKTLQAHHKQYHFYKKLKQFKLPWAYEPHLLITLCEKCHQKGKEQFKVPTKYI